MYKCTCSATDGAVYSCDKLVLGFRAAGRDASDIMFFLTCDPMLQTDVWRSFRIGTYRDQWRVKCANGESFWVGVGLQDGARVNAKAIRIEFNPNKVGDDPEFARVWVRLRTSCVGRVQLVRWDLAADYPVAREGCTLVKDRRLYEEIRHSDADRTQYLGQRNHSGRCKLYNKALERGESGALTRLELSLDLEDSMPERAAALWPVVYGLQTGGANLDGLNETDAFIVRTLLDAPDRLSELSRRKRDKLEPILAAARGRLAFDRVAYMDVLQQISLLLWGANHTPTDEYHLALWCDDPWTLADGVPPAQIEMEVEQLEL